jgi:hypothetical protein
MTDSITTFEDIEYAPLRSYNQCVMFFNIREDSGEHAAQEYLERISQADRTNMLMTYETVKKLGAEAVKRYIVRTMPVPEEELING